MTLQIGTLGYVVIIRQNNELSATEPLALGHRDQRELLEVLARIHDFTLIDREERKELQALVDEVDEDDNQYDNATQAWTSWQDRAEALASAVRSAMRFDLPGEV